jgi:hypothetical protein
MNISTTPTQEVYNNVPLICYNVIEEMDKIQHYDNVVIQLEYISGVIGQSPGSAQFHKTVV